MADLIIGVIGALGRMGRTLAECAREMQDVQIGALVLRPGHPRVGELSGISDAPPFTDDPRWAAERVDVLIDFALPSAFDEVVEAARSAKTPLVTGTTGLSADQMRHLDQLGEEVPVLWSPNMSVGVQVMANALGSVAAALGMGYEVEIVETHHRFKRDAPSGTAKRLAEAVAEAQPEREPDQIPIHAIRGGDVVGDHSVHFIGLGDRLEITHRATNRSAFAMGALWAARWLRSQSPGRYRMADLVADEVRSSQNEV